VTRARKAAIATFKRIDPYVATLLGKITDGKQLMSFQNDEEIFSQGDRADSIY